MVTITAQHLAQFVDLESHVHYGQPPPPGREPFVVVRRPSPVLISAPHGAITHRNNERQEWHDEDDYTAGMALLLSELCGTSVLATIWRTDDSDPNYHAVRQSPYKQALAQLVNEMGIRWTSFARSPSMVRPGLGADMPMCGTASRSVGRCCSAALLITFWR